MSLQNSAEIPKSGQETPKVETAEAKPEQRVEKANEGEDNVINAAERFVTREMRDVKAAESRYQNLNSNIEPLQKASLEKYPTAIVDKISALLVNTKASAEIAGNAFEVKKSNRELQDVKKFIELSSQFKGMDKAALEAKRTELLADLKNLQGHERDVVAEGEYNQTNKALDAIEAYTHGLATMERKMKSQMDDASPEVEAPRMAA